MVVLKSLGMSGALFAFFFEHRVLHHQDEGLEKVGKCTQALSTLLTLIPLTWVLTEAEIPTR
jgi:hypothetical protein